MVARFIKDSENAAAKVAEFAFFILVLGVVFLAVFEGGSIISGAIDNLGAAYLAPLFQVPARIFPVPFLGDVMAGLYSGLVLGLGLVVSYLLVFQFAFALLEESNFIARVSHDANFIFQKMGLSGRAALPLLFGYGCTVPAILGAKVARTENEKIAIGFISLFLPCAARTSVILALIGAFLGPQVALAVYVIDAAIVLAIGVALAKLLGMTQVRCVLPKPAYRMPNVKNALALAYFQVLEFAQMSLPWIVAGTVFVNLLAASGLLDKVGEVARPALSALFGLPGSTFIPFVFGIVRGELTLVMLASVGKTTNFALLLTPRQMLVFAIISIIYVPCLSTIAALVKEFGKRKAAIMLAVNLLLTVIIGVAANAALSVILG